MAIPGGRCLRASDEIPIDMFSVAHFATGVGAGFIGVSVWPWLIAHTVFELWENSSACLGIEKKPGTYQGDSAANTMMDGVCAMCGWMIGFATMYQSTLLTMLILILVVIAVIAIVSFVIAGDGTGWRFWVSIGVISITVLLIWIYLRPLVGNRCALTI